MPRKSSMFLQFLTYGMLIGLSHGTPLIGQNVRDARPGEFLFVVSIARRAPNNYTNFESLHFCTGTLISRKSVLTAAHCFWGRMPRDVEVIAGSADVSLGHKYYPEKWINYNEWKGYRSQVTGNFCRRNDIGIITLEGQGVTDPRIHPAEILILNTTVLTLNINLYGSIVKIAGWGISEDQRTRPLVLKMGALKVLSNWQCREKFRKLLCREASFPNDHFCSAAVPWIISTCGDSGAPVLNKWNQVVGVHRGVCPKVDGYPYSIEYRYRNQVNTHLHLYRYRGFIANITT